MVAGTVHRLLVKGYWEAALAGRLWNPRWLVAARLGEPLFEKPVLDRCHWQRGHDIHLLVGPWLMLGRSWGDGAVRELDQIPIRIPNEGDPTPTQLWQRDLDRLCDRLHARGIVNDCILDDTGPEMLRVKRHGAIHLLDQKIHAK